MVSSLLRCRPLPSRARANRDPGSWLLASRLSISLLAAWIRLLGLYDYDDLKDTEPDTLRYRLLSLPAPG
jgi:hypothetical protein